MFLSLFNLTIHQGAEQLYTVIKDMTGINPNPFFKICWLYLTPLVSLVSWAFSISQQNHTFNVLDNTTCQHWTITYLFPQGTFIYSLVEYQPLTFNRWYVYPSWAYVLGWIMALSSILLVPGRALYKLSTGTGSLSQVGSYLTLVSVKLKSIPFMVYYHIRWMCHIIHHTHLDHMTMCQ